MTESSKGNEQRSDHGQAWGLPAEDVLSRLHVDSEKGLSESQVGELRSQFGANELPKQTGTSPLKLFLNQFNSFILWVLYGAAAIAGFLGEWVDTVAILVIILLNGILGFVQEFRAEKSLAALRELSSPISKVLRDGQPVELPSNEIVPGDIVLLEAGDRIPADGRLIHAAQIKTQEAALTGESLPIAKITEPIPEEKLAIAERKNMLFMGTAVVNGVGKLVVTETGLRTELGKIAQLLQEEDDKTPLQERLDSLGKRLVGICIGIVTLVFGLGLLRGNPVGEMLMTALSLAVAAIPEGLPAVVTIALAIGVHKMAKRNALVRRLPSVETLGCANVICSDKTGTLTQNKMMVREVWTSSGMVQVTGEGYATSGDFLSEGNSIQPAEIVVLNETLQIGVLCNEASLNEVDGVEGIVGDPTEGALLVAGAKAGHRKEALEEKFPRVEEIPFDSERKRMSILRQSEKGLKLYVKGAPDVLLKYATKILVDGEVVSMEQKHKDQIQEANHQLASQALRVLAVACREVDESESREAESLESNLIFTGLFAMMDPPRPEVKDAIAVCRKAGIRPVMITGDHKLTAMAVADELGLREEGALAFSGAELDAMSDDELREAVPKVSVYARVSAEHKIRVVSAWRHHDAVVAMTGDGVNDAPAVKKADIGVAMGITGTDVTKEASDMVITDDNFASVVSAVEQGRGIYDNIGKFVKFLLAFNLAEILVLLVGILIGFKDPLGNAIIPLSALQILWVNLISDGAPAIALGVDPLDPRAMSRPPRPARESMFTKNFVLDLLMISVITATGVLFACYWGAQTSAEMAQTMTLTTLILLELVGVQIVRANYHISLFSNKWLVFALLLSFGMQLLLVYVPALQALFSLVPLGWDQWVVILPIVAVAWTVARLLSWARFRKA